MHNKLRYQAKTISEKLSKKKNSASSPPIFFLKNKSGKTTKTCLKGKRTYV
jgi:hypothetical protein